MKKTSIAIGGPASGRKISSETERVVVPVKMGPDRGDGDHGFGQAVYLWTENAWRYEADITRH